MNNFKLAWYTNDTETLDRLSYDESWRVRLYVAFNPNTTPEILDRLSYVEDCSIRRVVAYNHNTSPETLERLSYDEDPGVRWEVARTPKHSSIHQRS